MRLGTAEALDLELLRRLGSRLDSRPKRLAGKTVREMLMEKLLRIRTRQGQLLPLRLNPAQQELERRSDQRSEDRSIGNPDCGRKDIVLKARQLGITTYVAARFLVHVITRPGTLSVQVAHDQTAAEAIFRIVHRFVEHLPERLRAGALCTSRVFTVFFLLYGLTPYAGRRRAGIGGAQVCAIAHDMLGPVDRLDTLKGRLSACVTPDLYNHPWLEKPALDDWRAMFLFQDFGVHDWSARLPSTTFAFIMIGLIYLHMRRFRPGGHLDAALITVACAWNYWAFLAVPPPTCRWLRPWRLVCLLCPSTTGRVARRTSRGPARRPAGTR